MATKTEIGTTLEGQDAIDFVNYMKRPVFTKDAVDCMKEAIVLAKAEK